MTEPGPVGLRIRFAAYLHAFFWGLGTGLFSAHLLRYLVRDLCHGQPNARVATTIAWIIAAPRLAGVLRLFVPTLMDRSGNRKRFCIGHFLAAPIVLTGLPLLLPALVRQAHQTGWIDLALALLVVFWCVYHLLDYFAVVSLFSWYGDLVGEKRRGAFLGARESWLIAGMALGLSGVGIYSHQVIDRLPEIVPKWKGYLGPAAIGLAALFLSVFPLTAIPEIPWKRDTRQGFVRRLKTDVLEPLADTRFAAFVFFGCWVQMSQAFTQGIQYAFSMNVIGISMMTGLGMSTTTRVGQWIAGPTAGKLSDRLGTAPVMMSSLILAACGSLFYYFAEPGTWWLLFGAALAWIFWVGVNIGVMKTVLDLAPEGRNSSYLAVYFTLTTLTFALFTLFGGHLIPRGYERLGFLCSFELRLAAVPVLWFVFRYARRPGGH